jgi:prophage regulatory protein
MAEQLRSPLAILRLKQVQARIGLSRSTIYERIRNGANPPFPRQVSLGGGRAVGFIEREIEEYLAKLIERSRESQEIKP